MESIILGPYKAGLYHGRHWRRKSESNRRQLSPTRSCLSPHQEFAPTAQVESEIVAHFQKTRTILKLSQNDANRIPTKSVQWSFQWKSRHSSLQVTIRRLNTARSLDRFPGRASGDRRALHAH